MPHYITPSGSACTRDEAFAHGRLRAGYREIVGDGESVGFDLAFRDNKSPASVFLTDSAQDAAIRSRVERDRMIHANRFAFMGDSAPAFDEATAIFLARNEIAAEPARAMRDVALAERYLPSSSGMASEQMVADARAEMIADMRGDWSRAVRDLALANRY